MSDDYTFPQKLAKTIQRWFPSILLNNSIRIAIFLAILFIALFIPSMVGVAKKKSWARSVGWTSFTIMLLMFVFLAAWHFQDPRWDKNVPLLSMSILAVIILFFICFLVMFEYK